MTNSILTHCLGKCLIHGYTILALAGTFAIPGVAQAQNSFAGTLPDGTAWLIEVPAEWNGVLLRDLDFATRPQSERYQDLLAKGYAISGLSRHPLRNWQYDPQNEIRNMEMVQDIFEERYQPKYVLQFGCSGGGLVAFAAAEAFADRIDGAIALSGHGPQWIMSSYLDGWFALRALLGEAFEEAGLGHIEDLQIVNFPNGTGPDGRTYNDIRASWRSAIETLGLSPQGRARIALAVAIGQWSPWQLEERALPDPLTPEALADLVVPSVLRITSRAGGTARLMFENAASGQQLSGNEGIDYAVFYRNASPIMKQLVEYLYTEAGLDVTKDIETINAAPRIPVSDYALNFWGQPGRTGSGDIKVPVIRSHSLGDDAIPYSLMLGYGDLVERKGNAKLYREVLLNFSNHCAYQAAETTTLVEKMIERLETGEWPDMSPAALNAAAAELNSPGTARFMDTGNWNLTYNRSWTPMMQ